MTSAWNALLERLLAERDLTLAEHRLVLAIARNTLGWRKPDGHHLGRALLREEAGLDGRNFTRARDALIEKGLLHYIPGAVGRGNRGFYRLLLTPSEKAAPERPFEPPEKAAPQRPKATRGKGRSTTPEKAAPQRPRRGNRKGKNTPASPVSQTIQTKAVDAYLSHGGSLELDGYRGALVRQATGLAKDKMDEELILAAAAQLGRERAFPGYLKQYAAEIEANGGPCKWRGLDRARLDPQSSSRSASAIAAWNGWR